SPATASIRPRLIAVDDRQVPKHHLFEGVLLQFGHGSSPWMTALGDGRHGAGRRASIRPRLIAVDDLHHLAGGHEACRASIRPRLIAVDDDGITVDPPEPPALQFGQGSSAWMTNLVGGKTPDETGFNSATAHRRG